MKYVDNINELALLNINYMGLIFYEKSPRFVDALIHVNLPNTIQKVGVFVNAHKDYILQTAKEFELSKIQLHGNETPEMCANLKSQFTIIKAFSIATSDDFEQTKTYENACDYFLFDTKTSQYGGSGQKFDWNILNSYTGNKPFYLSGGISAEDVAQIKAIKHPALWAIDLNSRFEIAPALKDIKKLEQFINNIQS